MPTNNNRPDAEKDENVPITDGNRNSENDAYNRANSHSYTVTYTSNNQPPPPEHLMRHQQLHHLHQQFHQQLHQQLHNPAPRQQLNEITDGKNL